MIRLNFIEVIVFYEVPQIFIATDIFDTKYLCLLYPHDDELCYKYLAVRISEKRLNLFKGQIIDLLSIICASFWFLLFFRHPKTCKSVQAT